MVCKVGLLAGAGWGCTASVAAGRPTIGWAAADYYSILNFAVGNLGSSQEGRRCRAGAAGRLASTSAGLLGAWRLRAPETSALATGLLGMRGLLTSKTATSASAVAGWQLTATTSAISGRQPSATTETAATTTAAGAWSP